jgi:small GTP-binding protein
MLVYDVTSMSSYENVSNWRSQFIKVGMVVHPESFPMILVGNKTDLDDCRQVSENQGKRLAEENGNMLFIETSAKSNSNVEAAFKQIAEIALAR